MVKQFKARQFHRLLYRINQKSSNLDKWEKIKTTSKLDIAYT